MAMTLSFVLSVNLKPISLVLWKFVDVTAFENDTLNDK